MNALIALGSNAELETQSELALRLSFLDRKAAARISVLTSRTGQMLSALVRSLRRSQQTESRTPKPVVELVYCRLVPKPPTGL